MKGKSNRDWNPDLGLAILAATSEPPHTRQMIGAYMGITSERVRQIEEKALRRLRAALYRDKEVGVELKESFENKRQ